MRRKKKVKGGKEVLKNQKGGSGVAEKMLFMSSRLCLNAAFVLLLHHFHHPPPLRLRKTMNNRTNVWILWLGSMAGTKACRWRTHGHPATTNTVFLPSHFSWSRLACLPKSTGHFLSGKHSKEARIDTAFMPRSSLATCFNLREITPASSLFLL